MSFHLEEDDHPMISCKDAKVSDVSILVACLITHNRNLATDTQKGNTVSHTTQGKKAMSGLHTKDGSMSVACLITHHRGHVAAPLQIIFDCWSLYRCVQMSFWRETSKHLLTTDGE